MEHGALEYLFLFFYPLFPLYMGNFQPLHFEAVHTQAWHIPRNIPTRVLQTVSLAHEDTEAGWDLMDLHQIFSEARL